MNINPHQAGKPTGCRQWLRSVRSGGRLCATCDGSAPFSAAGRSELVGHSWLDRCAAPVGSAALPIGAISRAQSGPLVPRQPRSLVRQPTPQASLDHSAAAGSSSTNSAGSYSAAGPSRAGNIGFVTTRQRQLESAPFFGSGEESVEQCQLRSGRGLGLVFGHIGVAVHHLPLSVLFVKDLGDTNFHIHRRWHVTDLGSGDLKARPKT